MQIRNHSKLYYFDWNYIFYTVSMNPWVMISFTPLGYSLYNYRTILN